MAGSKLLNRIIEISQKAELKAISVAFYDYESALHFSYQGDRLFHAASTFKAAVLFALLKAAEAGPTRLDDRLQVRNRFSSIVDGSPYRIDREGDGDAATHRAIGRALPLLELARMMIVRSSNLATNLLVDYLTVERIQQTLSEAAINGLHVRRGVEDAAAFQAGINNETTAEGLVRLFRLFAEEEHLTREHREQALEIFFAQEFNTMIPAKLPDGVKVAHKTGEISTHAHDAGIVFPPDRKPYVVAVLTETSPATERRNRVIADISAAVYRYLHGGQRDEKHA